MYVSVGGGVGLVLVHPSLAWAAAAGVVEA